MKRAISLLMVLALLCTVFPQLKLGTKAVIGNTNDKAKSSYVIGNGVIVPNGNIPADGSNKYCTCDYPVGYGFGYHWCCWPYGSNVYYHAWGVYPNRYDNSTQYLRNVPASEKTFTASHLRQFLLNAASGALVRLDVHADAATSDSDGGHTLVFVKMNSTGDGAYFLEGNYDGLGRSALTEWKFDALVAQYGHYPYIKYISWPNAPAFTSESIPVSAYDLAIGGVNSVQVVGWAYDPDTPNESLEIHVYMDGVYIGKGVANTLREDVNAVYGCGNYHGFDITVPVTVAETGNHSIEVYALNTNKSGGNAYLGSKEVTITAHTHSYAESVTQAATCTQTGVKTYTCGSCADTYTEEVPATGHNYISEVVGATCTTVGHTAFTCDRCGDSYVEMSNGWSEWSTEYPAGVPENLIEEKIQYSTLEKEYTTSASDTLDGWTLYNTESGWSDYGEWSAWSDTPVSESDTVMVEQRTLWLYYYYLCPNCGDHMHGQGCYTWAGGCGSSIDWTAAREIWSTVAWESAGLQDWYGTGKYNAYIDGELVFKWTDNYGNGKTKTQFRSCTREMVDTYYFCRWSDEWSDWSDNAVESSEDIQVKTQTVYRYYIGELADHNYSYAVTKTPTTTATGVLTGTCTGCSGTTTETLPKLNTSDYTYSQVKVPSHTETGVGRYTWNTTAYGTLSFDVTLAKLANTGDLDGNGKVNEDDVIYLLQHLLMPGDFPVEQAVDYDKNNVVNEDDVIYLLQHLLMPDDFPL